MADETQLVQLFQNLLGNAIKFRGDKPALVFVGVECGGHDWLFHVRDNGIGIEPQYVERIFLIFQRLHGRSQHPGTGIGLAVAKKIVERHAGRIWVESEPGKGSTFYVALPAREPASHA
jgi:light-regulated signal transduction histidine kinase (bacteriophytochrome)